MYKWYLVQSKPKQEQKALQALEEQGHAVYCPMCTVNKRISTKDSEVMFPRYLFLSLSTNIITGANFSSIKNTRALSNGAFVKFGNTLATIDDRLIMEIKSRELEGITDLSLDYKAGDLVTIKSGPFALYKAIITKKRSRDRVELLLSDVSGNVLINTCYKEICQVA